MPLSTKQYRILFWTVIIGAGLLIAGLCHLVHLKTIHAWGENINGWLLFALMSVLPLVGVPMSILSVMAGVKFGPGVGILVVGITAAIHLAASWWLARNWLRSPVKKLLKKTDYKMPRLEKGEYANVCLLTALVPGPSYTLKNYFLVLSNLPLKIIFLVGLPAHLFAMSPGILFGDFTGKMTVAKGSFLVVYLILVAGVCRWLVHRVRARRHHSKTRSAISGK